MAPEGDFFTSLIHHKATGSMKISASSRLLSMTPCFLLACLMVTAIPAQESSTGVAALLQRASDRLTLASSDTTLACLDLADQILQQPGGITDASGQRLQIKSWLLRARIHRQDRRHVLVRTTLQKALDSCAIWFPDDDSLAAEIHHELGEFYFQTGDFVHSGGHLEKALQLRLLLYGEHDLRVAESFDEQGWLEISRNQMGRADSSFRRALAIRLAQPAPDKLMLAASYKNLAALYGHKDDFGGALDNTQKALALALEAAGREHPLTAGLYLGLGNCYGMISDWDHALEYYQISHEIMRRIFGDSAPQLIASLNNIAEIQTMMGDYPAAIASHNRTREIIQSSYGENIYYANSCKNLGDACLKSGDAEAALLWYQRAAAVHEKLNRVLPLTWRQLQNAIADLYIARGEYRRALDYTRNVLNSYRPRPRLEAGLTLRQSRCPVDHEMLRTLELMGMAHRRLARSGAEARSELDAALLSYGCAAAVLDSMRRDLQTGRESSQQKLSARANQILAAAVATALERAAHDNRQEYQELAFRYVQEDKATALALALADLQAKKMSGIDSTAARQERELGQRLAAALTALELRTASGAEPEDSTLLALQGVYYRCAADYQSMIRALEKRYPRYYQQKYNTGALSMSGISSRLDRETALLEYYIADSTLYSFVITAEGFSITQGRWTPALVEAVALYRSALRSGRREPFRHSSAALHAALIAPAAGAIAGKKNLVILPHDCLYAVPFEALLTSQVAGSDTGRVAFLIESHAISYHYSSRIYAGASRDNSPGPGIAAEDLVAFAPFSEGGKVQAGNPGLFAQFLDAQTGYPSWIMRDGEGLGPLPASRPEVAAIHGAFRRFHKEAKSFIGTEATEEQFLKLAASARCLHLATHSFVNLDSPQLSGIAFQSGKGPSPQDGILYAGEIFGLDLNSDLVVLSSCESGSGKLLRGEGMISLTRGFLYAGVRNVMASLWKVEDRAASELMIDFYRHMLAGASYREALRQAKLQFIRSHREAGPGAWSGFVLYGE